MPQASSNIGKIVLFLSQTILFCSSVRVSDTAIFGDVSCNNSGLTVDISLTEDFKGVIYPLGQFLNPNCRYNTTVPTRRNITLFYPLFGCGTLVEDLNGVLYISNQIIIQKYSYLNTVNDVVRMVSCQMPHPSNEEAEEFWDSGNSFSHYKTNVLESWMEFRLGHSILGKDVPSKLTVGDEFLIFIYLKDGGKNRDFKVESCWAYEGETINQSKFSLPIYDRHSCGSYDLVSDFSLTTKTGNVSDFVTYAVVKAFKFPTTDNLHITCSIQVCKQNCPAYCKMAESERSNAHPRKARRSTSEDLDDKSLRERYRLMKATVKVLRAKLIESNKAHRSNENFGFRRRVLSSKISNASNYENADFEKYDYPTQFDIVLNNHELKNYSAGLEINANRMYLFQLTNKIVVYQNHKITPIFPVDDSVKCAPRLKFIVPLAVLTVICLLLLLACFALFLNLHQERKRRKIDSFMLYSIY